MGGDEAHGQRNQERVETTCWELWGSRVEMTSPPPPRGGCLPNSFHPGASFCSAGSSFTRLVNRLLQTTGGGGGDQWWTWGDERDDSLPRLWSREQEKCWSQSRTTGSLSISFGQYSTAQSHMAFAPVWMLPRRYILKLTFDTSKN